MTSKLITGGRDLTSKLAAGRRGWRKKGTTALNFDEAFRLHKRAVYKACYTLLRDAGLAEDVMQEVFLRLYRLPVAARPADELLRAWLLSVANNLSRNLMRSRTREEDLARQCFQMIWQNETKPAGFRKKLTGRGTVGFANNWDGFRDMGVRISEVESAAVRPPQEKTAAAFSLGGWPVRTNSAMTGYPNPALAVTATESRLMKYTPEVKEKQYLGVVKEVSENENRVLAEISPRGDADSWEAYLFLSSFKGRRPEVNDEFECTLTTHGSLNALSVRLLPSATAVPATEEYDAEEKELLAWAANLRV